MTEWRKVPQLEVSDDGRVRLAGKEFSTKCKRGNNVYDSVIFQVHRLVAYAFYGLPDNKMLTVDHVNGDSHDNRPENLEWVTQSENSRRMHVRLQGHFSGENNFNSKLGRSQVNEIRDAKTEKPESLDIVADRFGVCRGTLEAIRCGKNWKRDSPGSNNTKLTVGQVQYARSLDYSLVPNIISGLAKEFDVTKNTIRNIWEDRNWV